MTGVAALLLAATVAQAPTLQERFDHGAEHYWAGRFDEAAQAWRVLADYGIEDPELLYDLGNAAFQRGRAGEALAWYERARRRTPHDDDLLANMAAAEEALGAAKVIKVVQKGTAAGEGSFEWWYRLFTRFTAGQLAWIFGFFYLLTFGLLLSRRRMARGLRRTLVGWTAVVMLLPVLGFGGLVAGNAYVQEQVQVGVITGLATAVRTGPTPEARVLFELPEGQLVRLMDEQRGFRRALVNPALQGWVPAEQVMVVR